MKAAELDLDGVTLRKGAIPAYTTAVRVMIHEPEAPSTFPTNFSSTSSPQMLADTFSGLVGMRLFASLKAFTRTGCGKLYVVGARPRYRSKWHVSHVSHVSHGL